MGRTKLRWVCGLIFFFPLVLNSQVSANGQAAADDAKQAAVSPAASSAASTAASSAVSPAASSAALPAGQGEVTKFTSRAQLVLVPVMVTGKNGEHVSGLGREAFRIEEHGKVRAATVFEEVKTVAADPKAKPAVAMEGRSNFNYADAKNWRMTVVVLDMLNTPFLYQNESKRQLIQYLSKSLQRDEPTALFGLQRSGLKQLHPFTSDTAVLIAALKKVQGQVSLDESNQATANSMQDLTSTMAEDSVSPEAQQIFSFMDAAEDTAKAFQQRESIRTTLLAMTQIAHAYEAIPGRKTMIWASAGFPFMIDDPVAFYRMGNDMAAQYDETWRALVAADIAVYTVDVSGLSGISKKTSKSDIHQGRGSSVSPPSFDASERWASMTPTSRAGASRPPAINYDQTAQSHETLKAFAEATGGIPCVNSNDLERCFARAIDDSRSYYLLGYYLPSDDQKPGWRKLKVKVDAAGAQVRARQGFYVASPAEDTPQARQRQIVEALQYPVEFTGVQMNVREVPLKADAKPAVAGKQRHEFAVGVLGNSLTVDVQGGNAMDVTVLGVAFGADGKNVGQGENRVAGKLKPEVVERIRKSGMAVTVPMELAPGKYELRFAARDNLSGEIGTVEYPLEVNNH